MINSNSSAPRQQHLPRHTTTPQHTHPQFYGQIWKLRGDNVSEPRVWMTDCDWPPSALAGSPPGHWTQRGDICIFCQILSLYGNKPAAQLSAQHSTIAMSFGLEEWLRNCWQILCQESVMMNSELLSAMTSNQWFCYTSYKWIGIGWIWIMDLCSFWCRGGQIYCTLHQKTIKHSSFGRSNNLFQAVEQEISQIANTQQRSNWWKHKIFARASLGLGLAYLQADDNVTATVAGPGAGQVVTGRHVGEVW